MYNLSTDLNVGQTPRLAVQVDIAEEGDEFMAIFQACAFILSATNQVAEQS